MAWLEAIAPFAHVKMSRKSRLSQIIGQQASFLIGQKKESEKGGALKVRNYNVTKSSK